MFIFMWPSLFRVSDNGIGMLFLFMATFFKILAKFFQTDVFDQFANTLPKTLHLPKKILGPRRDMFLKHTTCPKCKSLYNTEDCRILVICFATRN